MLANSENPDQMPHSAASDLGLHCLPNMLSLVKIHLLGQETECTDNPHFYRLHSVVTLKIRSRSPKSNQTF